MYSLVAAILIFLAASTGFAATTYYVDPTYTNTGSDAVGSAADPWTAIAGHWSTINTALASGDVTIYISARIVGSDTAEDLAESIDLTQKTANPTGTLTINGNAFYNTNDGHNSGSWTAYTGALRAKTKAALSQNAGHIKYSKVSLNGIYFYGTVETTIGVCGDAWTVNNCQIEGNTSAPLVKYVPSSDSSHEGSSAWCTPMDGFTFTNNIVTSAQGEALYLGGGGCIYSGVYPEPEWQDNNVNNCQTSAGGEAYSHQNITVSGNTINNPDGIGEGDCIDIKAALQNVTISHNYLKTLATGACAITSAGWDGRDQNVVIDSNLIHDSVGDAGIKLSYTWGVPGGYTIQNNIFQSVTASNSLIIYDSRGTEGIGVYNNTFYNSSGISTYVATAGDYTAGVLYKGPVYYRNNAFLSSGNPNFVAGTTASNNAYSGSVSGVCTNCVSGLSATAGVDFTSAATVDFTVAGTGSKLYNAGYGLSGIVDTDYANNIRSGAWDIGAYEYIQTIYRKASGASTISGGSIY